MTETAYFAAGCFWGIEEAFRTIPGVAETAVGYMGGTTSEPTYEQVCSGTTGHAETTKVVFDPSQISYDKLLAVFWKTHDPTQIDRQGPDIGAQYRSAIFYTTPEQEHIAHASKEAEQDRREAPIATSIEPARDFWKAEEYHQQYIAKGGKGVCPV